MFCRRSVALNTDNSRSSTHPLQTAIGKNCSIYASILTESLCVKNKDKHKHTKNTFMKNKLLLLLLSGMIFTLSSFAKPFSATIKGNVKDENGKPLSAATIALHNAKDSVLIKTAVSNTGGEFEIGINNEGAYFVSISSVGYAVFQSQELAIKDGEQFALPSVTLSVAAKELGEVVVKAKKPMIEVKADKTIFNVENSINATGSNALELLQKSPGVQVDNNENISMKGKTGVKIFVDGKMMQLDSKDLADYLRSINSNDIEAIEMISNPSAKYDASGNAGIINIRLKKNKKYGTNGSVNVGFVQGVTPKGNGSVNLNYRDKKINLYGNASANIGQYENGIDLYRIQSDTIFDQHSKQISDRKSMNVKAGADYFINSNSTFGLMGNVNISDAQSFNKSQTDIYYEPTGAFQKTLVATNTAPRSRTNANFNANYRYADTSGRELNIDADYGLFSGTGRSYQPNRYYDPNGVLISEYIYGNYTPTDINIYTAKADYQQKAWKGVLGFGAKFSYVNTNNTFDFYNLGSAKPELDLNKSNSFDYTENVNAAYLNYTRELSEKWNLQAGLRAEQTNSNGELTRADGQAQDDDNVKRHYFDLFPSAALTYSISKKHSLNLAYSRRIDRPSYQDLNPFENKLDELTYQKGNAFLRPQYTNNVTLTHTFLGMINTSVGYSHVKDFATQVTDTANKNATYVQQQNLATQQILSVNIGSPTPIAKWWNGYVNVWFNQQMFDGEIGKNHIKRTYNMYGAYLQQTFTIGSKGTSAELSGWYNGPSVWGGTWRTKAQGGLDVGVMQQLFNKKGSVKVSYTDVFRTMPWSAVSDFGGLYVKGSGYWESNTFRVTFSYRFGSSNVKAARQRKSGLESESGRIKD
jgi:iron complex outermembrane receptor protein